MEKIKVLKGQTLHKKGDEVKKMEVLLSGALAMSCSDTDIRLNSGSLISSSFLPNETYPFDIVALEECSIASYDYFGDETIVSTVSDFAAIASAMASANMEYVVALLDSFTELIGSAEQLCKNMRYNYNDYKFLCAKVGTNPLPFSQIDVLVPPVVTPLGWKADMCRAFVVQKDSLKKNFYPLDVNFCIGVIMTSVHISRSVIKQVEKLCSFIRDTKDNTAEFMKAFYSVKSKVDGETRTEDAPSIKNALDVILAFSGIDNESAELFRKNLRKYIDLPDRNAKSDELRRLRMDLAEAYYKIYESAFFRSLDATHVPAEVHMLFLFGFIDEELAGEANTSSLYRTAVAWEKDPDGRILPMYDWLRKIYFGEAWPSKNEFDNDWIEYLREEIRVGSLSKDEANVLARDRRAMTEFELRNMFKSANKITSGQMASFVPFFTVQDVVRPLDKSLVSPAKAKAVFDKVTDIDFSCFYRPLLASFPDFGIQHFVYNAEVKPYLILMPNFGSRGLMWQEIEGVKKTTPAHMVISIFHSEDLETTLVRMCAQFRWEMCRRIQGVRYSDISEPSLTAEYTNYLQFYKKNSSLSSDMKDRIKLMLQKARNDYKNVFVADYEMYIINEAFGLPRLNKINREILFRYCTLSKKFRQSLASNPQFQPLFEKWGITQGAKVHGVELFVKKIQKMKPDEEIPDEILNECAFLRM